MDLPLAKDYAVPSQGGEASWASWKCDGGVHTSDILTPTVDSHFPVEMVIDFDEGEPVPTFYFDSHDLTSGELRAMGGKTMDIVREQAELDL